MKLALSSFAWPPERTGEVRQGLKAMSAVQGVELVLPMSFSEPATATEAQAIEVRNAWEDAGITVVSVQSLAFGKPDLQLFGNALARQRLLDHLEQMASLAAWMGAGKMVFGSPASRLRGNLAMASAMDIAIDFFSRLGELVLPMGIEVCVEPNPPIYAGCDFINTMEEALDLVQRTAHPAIKVQCDTGALIHAQRKGDELSAASLASALGLSGHLHISNPGLLPIFPTDIEQAHWAKRILPGLNLPWASIEMRTPDGIEPLDAITTAIDAVSTWYPIEH